MCVKGNPPTAAHVHNNSPLSGVLTPLSLIHGGTQRAYSGPFSCFVNTKKETNISICGELGLMLTGFEPHKGRIMDVDAQYIRHSTLWNAFIQH